MQKPRVVYKYENFTAQSLKNLKAQSVYFGSPLGFNDPYDCAIRAGIKELTDTDIEILRTAHLSRSDLPILAREQVEAYGVRQLRDLFTKLAERLIHEKVDDFLKNKGVTCFSERNDDLLMWSHYGGRYKGFCLEFSTDYAPFDKIKKVEYTPVIPKIDLMPVLLHDEFDQFINLFCTKSQSWSYEQEWRCLHMKAGTLFGYEAAALRGVYFGPDIDDESLEIICLILAGQNPDVKLWQGSRSTDEFKVNFANFTYTSYADAKQLGLR